MLNLEPISEENFDNRFTIFNETLAKTIDKYALLEKKIKKANKGLIRKICNKFQKILYIPSKQTKPPVKNHSILTIPSLQYTKH